MQTHSEQRKSLLASNTINASKQKQTIFWTDFEMDWVKKQSMCAPYVQLFVPVLVRKNHYLKLIIKYFLMCVESSVRCDLKLQKGDFEEGISQSSEARKQSVSNCEIFRFRCCLVRG